MIDFIKTLSGNFFVLSIIHNLAVLCYILFNDQWVINKKLLTSIQILRWIVLSLIFRYFPGDSIFFISVLLFIDIMTLKNDNNEKQKIILIATFFFYSTYLRPIVSNLYISQNIFLFYGGSILFGIDFLFFAFNIVKLEKPSS